MVHLVVPGLSIGCVFSILGYSVLVVFYVWCASCYAGVVDVFQTHFYLNII
jgi:hypothetical protein